MTKIICVTDTTERQMKFFALKNDQWSFERIQEEFKESMRGNFYGFTEFIKARGAVEVEIPTVNCPSYPDIDYD